MAQNHKLTYLMQSGFFFSSTFFNWLRKADRNAINRLTLWRFPETEHPQNVPEIEISSSAT